MNALSVSVGSGVVTLTLDRPEARNALTPELIVELERTIEAIGPDPAVRAVVLRGEGGAFCAGYDLNRLTSPGTRRPDASGTRSSVCARPCAPYGCRRSRP